MSHTGELENDVTDQVRTDNDGGVRAALEAAVTENTKDDTTKVEDVKYPDGFSDDDKKHYSTLAPEARTWFDNRYQTSQQQLAELNQKYTPAEQELRSYEEVFTPFADRLKTTGQTRQEVIKNLLGAQIALEQKPQEAFKWLANHYKIDLAKLVEGVEQTQDPLAELPKSVADLLKGLQEQVGTLSTAEQTRINESNRRMAENVQTQVTNFGATKDDKGAPKYPHVKNNEVLNRMMGLIKSGQVDVEKSGGVTAALEIAYDQAVWATKSTRDEMLKATQNAPTDRNRILRARRAGSSVRGAGASGAQPGGASSLRDTINAAARDSGMDL